MVRNLKSILLTGLFMVLGGTTLLQAGEYKLDEFRSVVGSGGMVSQVSSKNTYTVSAVVGQFAIESNKSDSYEVRRGFWVEDNDGTTDVNDGNLSLGTKISNYPNPFNSSTNISYELPGSALVTIKVYDVVGNEVKTIFDGFQNDGSQKLQWDGTDNTNNSLSSGSYVCEMNVRPASGSNSFQAFVTRNVMVIVR